MIKGSNYYCFEVYFKSRPLFVYITLYIKLCFYCIKIFTVYNIFVSMFRLEFWMLVNVGVENKNVFLKCRFIWKVIDHRLLLLWKIFFRRCSVTLWRLRSLHSAEIQLLFLFIFIYFLYSTTGVSNPKS